MRHWFLICLLPGAFSQGILATSPENLGSISVVSTLAEDTPELPTIVVDKNIPFCGKTLRDPILVTKNGAILNTVVVLDWQGDKPKVEGGEQLALSTEGCLLKPRIQTAQKGAFLLLNSQDEITHNPHGWLDGKRTVFNLTLTDPSLSFKRKLRWPGTYRIDCDTHAWMKAYILVFDHPYHAVADDLGLAVINGVPSGSYSLKIWHEVLGEKTLRVVVNQGHTTQLTHTFPLKDHRPDQIKPNTVKPWPVTEGLPK